MAIVISMGDFFFHSTGLELLRQPEEGQMVAGGVVGIFVFGENNGTPVVSPGMTQVFASSRSSCTMVVPDRRLGADA